MAGKTAASEIVSSGFKGALEVWELDLASFASVIAFGERCETLERLDCFVANAGIAYSHWSETADGWETT